MINKKHLVQLDIDYNDTEHALTSGDMVRVYFYAFEFPMITLGAFRRSNVCGKYFILGME